jgi:hypothetical protein
LSDEQIDRFIQDGFVKMERAFPREMPDEAQATLWKNTGCDPDDPSTWVKPVIRLGDHGQKSFRNAANTELLRQAFDQPVGRGRWIPRMSLGTTRPRAFAPDHTSCWRSGAVLGQPCSHRVSGICTTPGSAGDRCGRNGLSVPSVSRPCSTAASRE